MRNELIHDLALAWATMNGRGKEFVFERDNPDSSEVREGGRYDGYTIEADHVLSELESKGWTFHKT